MKKQITTIITFLILSLNSYSQLTQTIRGRVIDKESQTALPGANITISGLNPIIGTTTNTNGDFVIENIPVGRYNLNFSFIGYEPCIISSLMVSSGKEVFLNIELKESFNNLTEVVVKATKKDKPLNSMAMISARTFSAEETRRFAGGLDDPGRLVSVYAGVADGNLESNGIVVRGNAPSGVIYRVEGIEVDNPNHFAGEDFLGGGFVSIINSQVLGNSDFFTGAFPAEYGNALSAVFDMNLRTGNTEKREYAFQAGALGIDFFSEGPFISNKRSSYLINYRYSTLGLVRAFLPEGEGLPKYQDLSFKLNFPMKKGVLSFWGAGGSDDYIHGSIDEVNYAAGKHYIDDQTSTGFVGAKYRHFINQTTYSGIAVLANASLKSNHLMELYTDANYYTKERIENISGKYALTAYINKKFGSRIVNRSGFNYSWLFFDFDNKFSPRVPQDPYSIHNNTDNTGFVQVYSQSKVRITESVTVNAGINYQYLVLNQKSSFEPRVGINWQISQKDQVSLAYGKHSQMQALNVYMIEREQNGKIVYPNKNLDFSRSHHLILAYDRLLNENMRVKIEPFFQYLTDIPVVDESYYSIINLIDMNTFNKILVSTGLGRNIGVDVTLERFFNKGYYFLGTLSIFDSQYRGGDNVWRNTRYNKNVVANILGGKEWKIRNNYLGINGRLYLKDGDRTTAFDQDASIIDQEVVYDNSRAFEQKYPFTYRCDMSLTYTINRASYSSKFAIQLMNVFNSVVSFEDSYNSARNRAETVSGRMMLPSVSWKIEF